MDTIYVLIKGEIEGVLPDISYDQFCVSDLYKNGDSELAYYAYLKENNMIELSNYNDQTVLPELELLLHDDFHDRFIVFKPIYDSRLDEDSIENKLDNLIKNFNYVRR